MNGLFDDSTPELPAGIRALRLPLGARPPRRLACLAWGPEGAPPVVLLHGGGGHALWWVEIASELARDYRVLALDLRGHGRSDWAEPPAYQIADFVADIESFLDRLGLAEVYLAGHSLGGRIAACFAARRPERVRALAVLDTRFRAARKGVMTEQRRALVRSRIGRRYGTLEEALRAFRFVPPEPEVEPSLVRTLARYAVGRTEEGSWSMRFDRATLSIEGDRAGDITGELERVTCPTLLVRAADSRITSDEEYRTAAARMRKAESRTLPGGHHFLLRYPALVTRLLTELFEHA